MLPSTSCFPQSMGTSSCTLTYPKSLAACWPIASLPVGFLTVPRPDLHLDYGSRITPRLAIVLYFELPVPAGATVLNPRVV